MYTFTMFYIIFRAKIVPFIIINRLFVKINRLFVKINRLFKIMNNMLQQRERYASAS